MAQSIYGGRVDNEFDQRLLNTFLERLFTTRSFDSEFKLACKVDGHKDIQMPDGIRCVSSPPPQGGGRGTGTSSHGNVLTDMLLFQARGVRAVGGAAPRHADAFLAGPAQQRREGSPHHAGWVPRPAGQPGTPPPTTPEEAGKPSAQAMPVLQPPFWDTGSVASM